MAEREDNPDIHSLGIGTGKGSQPISDTLPPLHSPAFIQAAEKEEPPHYY